MMHTNGIVQKFVERKEETIGARVLRYGRQRAADVTHTMSRRGAAQANAELCNEAVNKLIGLAYEPDTDGQPANVDVTGRLLIPAPWGRAGHQHYGLRRREGEALRYYLYRLIEQGEPAPLFTYDRRSWWLNIYDYPSLDRAINYWRKHQMTATSWRACVRNVSAR